MNGYLKRLATRGGVESTATGVRPLVRSRSPIAAQDQRIGMPGFGSPSLDQAISTEGRTLEDRATDAPTFDSPFSPPTTTRVSSNTARERVDLVPSAKADHTTPKSVAGMTTPVVTRPAVEASLDVSASERTSSALHWPDTPASVNESPALMYKTVVPRGAGIKEVPEAHLEGAEKSSSTYLSQSLELDSSSDKSGEAKPTRLEPMPRAILSPGLREPASSEDFQSSDRIEQEPRVVIGRINVEVVPPPAETKTTAPPRPGPLTAESVSVIGPISRRVGSSLRLNLKHR